MPFPISWLKERLVHAHAEGRLAHAYLIHADPPGDLRQTFTEIADALLQADSSRHPDVHLLQPESKSRRIRVEQVRELEHLLQLKSLHRGLKIAGVIHAERMCLPPAEAANAFLKTLEEPPEHCLILLLTHRPSEMLPTIMSRCLRVQVLPNRQHAVNSELLDWCTAWMEVKGSPADRALIRSNLLLKLWASTRERIESETPQPDGMEDSTWEALVQSRLLQERDDCLAQLIHFIWDHKRDDTRGTALMACSALEELRAALARNLNPALATTRCLLVMEGLI